MADQPTTELLLERALLRKSVSALSAGNSRCRDCRRTLLTGERSFVYEDGNIACALCRPRRREQPVREVAVRDGAHGATVRLQARAA